MLLLSFANREIHFGVGEAFHSAISSFFVGGGSGEVFHNSLEWKFITMNHDVEIQNCSLMGFEL